MVGGLLSKVRTFFGAAQNAVRQHLAREFGKVPDRIDLQLFSKGSELTTSAKKVINRLGLTDRQFRKAVHDIKKRIEGNPDLMFDLKTGDVFDQRSGELVGNLLDYIN